MTQNAVSRLFLRLWACIGLVLLVLTTAHPGVASAMERSIEASPSAVDAAAWLEAGPAHAPSPESSLRAADDRNLRSTHRLGAMQSELGDEDPEVDADAVGNASTCAFERTRSVPVPDQALVETGRPWVAIALARGPPAAR